MLNTNEKIKEFNLRIHELINEYKIERKKFVEFSNDESNKDTAFDATKLSEIIDNLGEYFKYLEFAFRQSLKFHDEINKMKEFIDDHQLCDEPCEWR